MFFTKPTISALFVAMALAGAIATAQAAPGRIGSPSVPAAIVPVGGSAHVLASSGNWSVVADGYAAMVVDQFDDGAQLGIMKGGDGFSLILRDPTWRLPPNRSFPVSVSIDGDLFTGRAEVTGYDTLTIAPLAQDAVDAIFDGEDVELRVIGSSWRPSMQGAKDALDKAQSRVSD